MSYARWGDDSAVYVFLHAIERVLTCFGCELEEGNTGFSASATVAMLNHLRRHVDEGHKVPQYTFEGLIANEGTNDRWMRKRPQSP